ncbi:MAG: hypothetical protein IKI71_02325 [Lachnospiraceae bacterium]|nr:hypothetical protein [Lachnospiraceae bacterium]
MMDQIEFENLIEKMKRRKDEGDIKRAMKVADKIPWDEVKDVNLLIYVASIYEEGENYRDAKMILEYAYDIAPVKNRLYFALSLVNAKCKELKDAISYFIDFDKSFPEDSRKKLLEYYIMKAKGAGTEQLKRILTEYLAEEKDEKMSFELALLSDKLEEREEVLEICNFIVNFYGVKRNGYGKNALLLKKKYAKLTNEEEKLLVDAEIGYVRNEDAEIEYKEPPNFYNDIKLDEEKINIPVEKVERISGEEPSHIKELLEKNEDELNENQVPQSINISYTPDEESYAEKEKNKMAFLSEERNDKDKLKKLINELKEEERLNNSEFNKFRQKSFEKQRRFKKMKLSETKLHMIIEAHSKEEGTDIAKKELEYIHNILGEKAVIAKASAYNMNEKDFAFYEGKISGKDLIIENAGQLKNELIDEIEEFIINKKGKTLFALVDVINNFDKLATERPSFVGRFDIYSVLSSRPQESLDVTKEEVEEFKATQMGEVEMNEVKDRVATPKNPPEKQMNLKNERPARHERGNGSDLSVDEFVEECKKYAADIDCVIPSEAIPALYEKAEEMQESKMPLNKENAEALIEEVADRAEKPKMFKKPKYDKEGCLILSEEHFNF